MIPVTGNGLLTLIRDFQGRSRSDEERRAVERQNYELQNALKTVFGAVLLDPLRAEVRHQMDAISAARAKAEQG